MYTVYIWFWPTLHMTGNTNAVVTDTTCAGCASTVDTHETDQ